MLIMMELLTKILGEDVVDCRTSDQDATSGTVNKMSSKKSGDNVEDINHPDAHGVLEPVGHVVDIKTPNPAVDSNKLLKMHWREDPKPKKPILPLPNP